MSTTVTTTAEFSAALASPPGDNLIIVNASGSAIDGSGLSIPSGVTIRGATVGTSEIQFALNGVGEIDPMQVASNVTIEDLIFSAPATGSYDTDGGVNQATSTQFRLIDLTGSGVTFNHCKFDALTGQLVRIQLGGRNATFYHCYFLGAYYGVLLNGFVSGGVEGAPRFSWCWFRGQGEGIKCISGGPVSKKWSDGTKVPDIENCYFQNWSRNAVDTTRGWRNLWIKDCMFWGGTALDLKTNWAFEGDEDYPSGGNYTAASPATVAKYVPWNIHVDDCHFVTGGRYAICNVSNEQERPLWMSGTATVDPSSLTDEYDAGLATGLVEWLYYGPREYEFNNCILEPIPGTDLANTDIKAFLMRGGYNIAVTNLALRGNITTALNWSIFADDRNYIDYSTADYGSFVGKAWNPIELEGSGYESTWTATGTTTSAAPTSGLEFPGYDQTADPASVATSGAVFTGSSGAMLLIGGKPLIL